jgi:hypothetical protein
MKKESKKIPATTCLQQQHFEFIVTRDESFKYLNAA